MKYRFLLAITVVTTVIASFYFLTLGSINITFKEDIKKLEKEEIMRICKQNNIKTNVDEIFKYLHDFPIKKNQLSIFDFLDE